MHFGLVLYVGRHLAIDAVGIRIAQGNDGAMIRLTDVERSLVIQTKKARLRELVGCKRDAISPADGKWRNPGADFAHWAGRQRDRSEVENNHENRE